MYLKGKKKATGSVPGALTCPSPPIGGMESEDLNFPLKASDEPTTSEILHLMGGCREGFKDKAGTGGREVSTASFT